VIQALTVESRLDARDEPLCLPRFDCVAGEPLRHTPYFPGPRTCRRAGLTPLSKHANSGENSRLPALNVFAFNGPGELVLFFDNDETIIL
jgi:hypothetical protein